MATTSIMFRIREKIGQKVNVIKQKVKGVRQKVKRIAFTAIFPVIGVIKGNETTIEEMFKIKDGAPFDEILRIASETSFDIPPTLGAYRLTNAIVEAHLPRYLKKLDNKTYIMKDIDYPKLFKLLLINNQKQKNSNVSQLVPRNLNFTNVTDRVAELTVLIAPTGLARVTQFTCNVFPIAGTVASMMSKGMTTVSVSPGPRFFLANPMETMVTMWMGSHFFHFFAKGIGNNVVGQSFYLTAIAIMYPLKQIESYVNWKIPRWIPRALGVPVLFNMTSIPEHGGNFTAKDYQEIAELMLTTRDQLVDTTFEAAKKETKRILSEKLKKYIVGKD